MKKIFFVLVNSLSELGRNTEITNRNLRPEEILQVTDGINTLNSKCIRTHRSPFQCNSLKHAFLRSLPRVSCGFPQHKIISGNI